MLQAAKSSSEIFSAIKRCLFFCRKLLGEALAVEDLRELRPTVCENLVKLARKSYWN